MSVPESDLALARRGTEFFLTHLAQLSDADLDAPSLLPGWSRRHVVAHVGFNAKALTRLADWAKTGVEQRMYPSQPERNAEIDDGAGWSPAALRALVEDTAAVLDERWQAMTSADWSARVRTNSDLDIPASETVWMRCREVWIHTVDLGVVTFDSVPETFNRRLLIEVVDAWRGDAPQVSVDGDLVSTTTGQPVHGSLPAVTAWAIGRGTHGVHTAEGAAPPTAPHWR